jgi:NADPH:quinone reductase-like Zn-dependent oxidoreductase
VRVEAASVNPVDYKTPEGKFPKAPDDALPITLGRDLSGVVEEVGIGASIFSRTAILF